MKAIEMKLPNDGRDRAPTGHSLKTNEISSIRNLLQIIKFLGCSMGVFKQLRLLPRLLVALHKLAIRSHYCRWHLHNSLNREKSSQCLHRAFTPTSQHLRYRKVLCLLQKGKGKYQSAKNPSGYGVTSLPGTLVQQSYKACGRNHLISDLS